VTLATAGIERAPFVTISVRLSLFQHTRKRHRPSRKRLPRQRK